MSDSHSPQQDFHDSVATRLFEQRTVLLFGEITMKIAHDVCAQLVALSSVNSSPIRIILHSPGGHVESGDTIHDVIRWIKPSVYILGTGWVASAGALIFAAARKEHRFCLPNTRFLLHEPLGGAGGPAANIEIEVQQILQMKQRLLKIFADATGQPLERIAQDTTRDHWMTAQQAVQYGLVGKIIEQESELPL